MKSKEKPRKNAKGNPAVICMADGDSVSPLLGVLVELPQPLPWEIVAAGMSRMKAGEVMVPALACRPVARSPPYQGRLVYPMRSSYLVLVYLELESASTVRCVRLVSTRCTPYRRQTANGQGSEFHSRGFQPQLPMWQLPSESHGHSNCPGLTLLLWLVAVRFELHILGKMLVAFLSRYRKAVRSAVGECR